MPYYWVRILTSPPLDRRNDVIETCRRYGGRLVDHQIYYDDADGLAWSLIEVPPEEEAREALFEALGAQEGLGLVDADERVGKLAPPPSFRRDLGA